MIFRYFKVYVYDLPKKIPADAKLYVRTIYGEGVNRDLKWVEETSYQGFFKYKEGSLNDGFREVLTGGVDCWEYKNLESSKYDIARIIKDWGKKEAKNIFMVKTLWLPGFICANLAIRKSLVEGFNIKGIYDGSPFCVLYKTNVT